MAFKLLIVACFLATLVVSGDSADSKVISATESGDDADNIDINSLYTCAKAIENEILGFDLPKVQTPKDCADLALKHMAVHRWYKESCYQFRHELKESLLDEGGPIMQTVPKFCKRSFIVTFRMVYLFPDRLETCAEDIEKELLMTKPGPDCVSYALNQMAVYREYSRCIPYMDRLKQRLLAENGSILRSAPTGCKNYAISAFDEAYEQASKMRSAYTRQ